MEMKEKLITDLTETVTPSTPQYFIHRYNQVIHVYNMSISSPEQQLTLLDTNQAFQRINKVFAKPQVKVSMVFLLAFVPFLNLAILGVMLFYYMFLFREGRKHRKNLIKQKNPMKRFYFLPDICYQLGKHCTTMTLKTRDLQGFTFNTDLYQQLKSKQSQEEEITVTIYDQYFYDSYHLFRKQQYGTAAWILLAIFLVATDVIFYVQLFGLK